MKNIKDGLIVSCQALEHEPLHSSFVMGKMALSALEGGAVGIRANGVEDILEIKDKVNLPIIGIIKKNYGECPVFITPTFKEVEELVKANVDIIAIDGTKRDRPDNISLENLVKKIKYKYPEQKIMADVSNLEEAIFCDKLGFDFVGTTLVGYTEYTKDYSPIEVLKEVVNNVKCKVIAEGNINTPELAREALELGAYSVVVGSMITRPQLITKKFVDEIKNRNIIAKGDYFAFDIGGTNVKYSVISSDGTLKFNSKFSTTNFTDINILVEKMFLLVDEYLEKNILSGIGISCTGVINPITGTIVGGINLMDNWLGYNLKDKFCLRYNLPVYVDNDVNCVALGEMWQGVAQKESDFICITIGTGIGGAIVIDRQLVNGVSYSAGEIGHTTIYPGGLKCRCGKNGCFEMYGSTSALINKVNEVCGEKLTGLEIFSRGAKGDKIISEIIERWVFDISIGIANLVQTLNVRLVIIGGAVSQQEKLLCEKVDINVRSILNEEFTKKLTIKSGKHFNNSGMIGSVYGLIKK